MYLPNVTPYQTPMGIPCSRSIVMITVPTWTVTSNIEELYPNTAKRILREVDENAIKWNMTAV
jgi:hypothetical protein